MTQPETATRNPGIAISISYTRNYRRAASSRGGEKARSRDVENGEWRMENGEEHSSPSKTGPCRDVVESKAGSGVV